MPGGLPLSEPLIGADDLAWLATQPDVEARLVFTETGRDGVRYRVRHGPFSERRLRRLPTENWTLLVHDVEKHLPEFRAYCDAASFVPDWRIDDLMISVAAPGGSVGPHRDRYDAFLCQASGRREWHLLPPEEAVPAQHRGELALLEPFRSAAPVTAGPSDVLYLPPDVPHWGIAVDLCITCSLGMRAPTGNALAAALGLEARPDDDRDSFYADPDLEPDEARAGMISPRALERAAGLVAQRFPGLTIDAARLARAFGSVVTAPKEFLAPEQPEKDEIEALIRHLAVSARTRVHGMARLAWWAPPAATPLAFVNGRARAATRETLVEFRQLCSERAFVAERCSQLTKKGPGIDFLRWLVASGAFDPVGAEM